MRTVYFDNSATTMMDPRVVDAMIPFMKDCYGNPSSLHFMGDAAAVAVRDSRKVIASSIGCKPSEVYFTSSGTESDNIAIQGAALASKERKRIITSAIEHSAILATVDSLREFGYEVTILPVDEEGFVRPDMLEAAMGDDVILVSVMAANNVVGSIQDLKSLSAIAHEHGALFHTDAVQGYTKMDLDVVEMGIDMMSISSHKFHGPKGVGAIYVRDGVKLRPLFYGGGQESNLRPATENVPGIVGMGKAAEIAMAGKADDVERMTRLRDRLMEGVLSQEGVQLNGPRGNRLCNNVHIRFPGVQGKEMVFALSDRGIAVSTASACTAESVEPSHVLTAMGVVPEEALSVLRVSISRFNDDADVDHFLEVFPECLRSLREKLV